MNYNTQNQPLPTYRDGELDSDYIQAVRKQRLTNALSHTAALGLVIASKVGEYATEVLTPVMLDVFDASHNTKLRADYFKQKHHLAEVAMRDSVGL